MDGSDWPDTGFVSGGLLPSRNETRDSCFAPSPPGCPPQHGGTSRSNGYCYIRLDSMFRCPWKSNLTRIPHSKEPKRPDSLPVSLILATNDRSCQPRTRYRRVKLPKHGVFTLDSGPLVSFSNKFGSLTVFFVTDFHWQPFTSSKDWAWGTRASRASSRLPTHHRCVVLRMLRWMPLTKKLRSVCSF